MAVRVRFQRTTRARCAFTLVELVVTMAIMTVAMAMFARTVASSARLDPLSRESAVAGEGCRTRLEEMRNHPFSELFALYNSDPADDPAGAGTAPGNHFLIEDLAPVGAVGYVGTISFPTIGSQVRENSTDALLGMPRDLNGDGVVDALDHTNDCIILPVRITAEWSCRLGKGGKRSSAMYTMFSRLAN